MGILIDGQWRDEELTQETGKTGEFRASTAASAIASPPTVHPASKPNPGVITSMSRMAARGRTAR